MKIGIIVAMDKEFAQLKKVFGNDSNIVLQKCGIGKVNAAIGATMMIEKHHPDVIISSGCAGGADPSLNVGDVVVAMETTYHDAYCGDNCAYGQIMGMPKRYILSDKLIAIVQQFGSDCHAITMGLMVSGDWFVDSREKMREIMQHFPEAKAVDMESCSIAQVCYTFGVPFVSFRIISDVPLKDHKAEMYFDFWERLADGSFEVTHRFVERLQQVGNVLK
ncbi:5'-methylthioadenosine/S-adenosylhomocysteine nucleosidase [Prevotella sp. HJM029]|uniref:5'-methylthioadenosine/S-adenosylhomocysteine nucleosidase n=1 Tax=Prevotella sp. HJM029 TaxID=1433844 RepID=UPI00048AB2D9|nr:5'-methylthioadenosine/S-adenosylhomocysteine nucleosidase [Prevotella sp. HJM029]MBF1586859.1 5'-methylthioadenosine/S-adenosylhomocysteine nucleosidase [Prevotella sp.]